jgi:hypothetical protein
MQWECVSDLRCSFDATFRRRVDGLLAKNRARGDGMGGEGGDDDDSGAPIKNYACQSISGRGHYQERRKRQIKGRGCAIGRLVETEISAADAQDGRSPPPNPTPIANMY